jgi:DNA-binding NtrC family response regulator
MSSSSLTRVLVVDDDPEVREVLGEYLERQGYDVEFAATAVGALGAVRVRRPAVVLLDLNMPGAVGGPAVVRAISGEAPVVVITAEQDLTVARRTLTDGAFDFVSKPFDLARVAEVVEAAIAHGVPRTDS